MLQTNNVQEINELIVKISLGDQSAFSYLFNMMSKPIFRFISTFGVKSQAAEDITQETFLRIIRKAKLFHFIKNGTAWIFQIAKNLTRNYIKKNKRYHNDVEITEKNEPVAFYGSETNIISHLDNCRFIETLDIIDRRIIILKTTGLTEIEIAKLLDLSERTIQRHMRAIRAKACQYYKEEI